VSKLCRGRAAALDDSAHHAGEVRSSEDLSGSHKARRPRAAEAVPVLQLEGVWKIYGESDVAVRDFNLTVAAGEFVSLLGPSGCGKTTTLRMLAGFIAPTYGVIRIAGHDVSAVAPKDRNVGIVFQHYALFPHLTVQDNVAFGLQIRHRKKSEIADKVTEYLQLVRLVGYEQRKPSQLSGGQQQRVALARALITEPQLILLDEPLGALDRKLREEMQIELQQLLRRVGITAIFVTHDQDEALTMSDRVAVMNHGVLEQLATPHDLYERPRTSFVAGFVGTSTMLTGTLQLLANGKVALDAARGRLMLAPGTAWRAGKVVAAIRPEKVLLSQSATSEPNELSGQIEALKYVGGSTEYRVRLNGGDLVIGRILNAGTVRAHSPGDAVTVGLPPQHLHVLDGNPDAETPEPVA
jgi:spermidine/putrescine transport system ATP-binding protein